MRRNSVEAFANHLRSLDDERLPEFAVAFKNFFLKYVDEDNIEVLSHIVKDDGYKEAPTVVFSRIAPEQNTKFALHLLLVLGEYDTELEFKKCQTFREAFAKAGLTNVCPENDKEMLSESVDGLVKKVILDIIPKQPVSTKKMDSYIVKSYRLLRCLILDDSIPLLELPPCLQTQLYADRCEDMNDAWNKSRKEQISSMIAPLCHLSTIPTSEAIYNATKEVPCKWNPLNDIQRLDVQSDESYKEQQFGLGLGTRAVDAYLNNFGSRKMTKGVLFSGAPGAGKTFLLQTVGLYAMSCGLRVMSAAPLWRTEPKHWVA